jgi:hypothetical protein
VEVTEAQDGDRERLGARQQRLQLDIFLLGVGAATDGAGPTDRRDAEARRHAGIRASAGDFLAEFVAHRAGRRIVDRIERLAGLGLHERQEHRVRRRRPRIPDQAARNGTIGDLVADKLATPTGAAADAATWAAVYRTLAEEWWSADVTDAGFSEEARRVAHAKALDALQSAGTPALYAANFAYDLGRDLARLTVPTLLIEVATPHEDGAIGRQAAAVLTLVPHAALATIEEPAGETLTLEHRAEDLATLID